VQDGTQNSSVLHKKTRLDICEEHLDCYGNELDAILDKIMTRNKTIHNSEPGVKSREGNGNIHSCPAKKVSELTKN
jgi:hypothetical protein